MKIVLLYNRSNIPDSSKFRKLH